MQKIKWYLVVFLFGAVLSASTVLYFVYRPATVTIAELRNKSELAAKQYRTETEEYSSLLSETGKRVNQLARDLERAAAAHCKDLERIEQLEDKARSLEELIINVQESSKRAYEHNRGIRDEAEAALSELCEYRISLENIPTSNGEAASTSED